MNLAGGFFYHYLAFKYRKRLWSPFLESLHLWLMRWQKPSASSIVIVGMSAGYNLKPEFLKTFKTIEVLEPDPIARLVFRWMHPDIPVIWHSEKVLFPDQDPWSLDAWRAFLRARPCTSVLFSNLLGQLRVLYGDDVDQAWYLKWRNEFQKSLEGKAWASFHDRWSGGVPFCKNTIGNEIPMLSSKSAVEYFEPGDTEVIEHPVVFHEHNLATYWNWEIRPGQFHVIEGVSSAAR